MLVSVGVALGFFLSGQGMGQLAQKELLIAKTLKQQTKRVPSRNPIKIEILLR
jgi:hypothetical protein